MNTSKALGSVSDTVKTCGSVHFTPKGAWMEDAQGQTYKLFEKNGVFVLPMWLQVFSGAACLGVSPVSGKNLSINPFDEELDEELAFEGEVGGAEMGSSAHPSHT